MNKLVTSLAPFQLWLIVEAILAIAIGVLILSVLSKDRSQHIWSQLQGRLTAWSTKPLKVLLGTQAVLALNMGIGCLIRLPQPKAHDEFSLWLATDTLLQGRLANPSLAFADSFNSFHILVEPSYASKYPLGQPVFMAIGQAVMGHPTFGVWLSLALSLGLLFFLSRRLMPLWMSTLLCVFVACHGPILQSWAFSFWGGGVTMLGGLCAVLGIVLLRENKYLYAGCWFGGGAALLCVNRPFEGFVTMSVLGGASLLYLRGQKLVNWLSFIAPTTILAAIGITIVLSHNHAVTGSPTVFPHAVVSQKYGQTGHFLFGSEKERPEYSNAQFAKFYDSSAETFRLRSTPVGFLSAALRKFSLQTSWYLGVFLLVPFCLGWRRLPSRALTLAIVAVIATNFISASEHPHYIGSIAGIIFLSVGLGFVRFVERLPRIALVCCIGTIATAGITLGYRCVQSPSIGHHRIALEQTLKTGKHIVFVAYSPDHSPHQEWVYNSADLDSQKVIWAHTVDQATDRQLLAHWPERSAWQLQPDQGHSTLKPLAP